MNPRGAIQLSFTIWLLQRWKRIKIFKNCTLKKVFGTSGLVNLVKLVFRVRASIYWYTPVVITEPAVPSARLLSLGSKVFPSKMQRMLNKDLARFIQALLSQQGQMLWRGEGGGTPIWKRRGCSSSLFECKLQILVSVMVFVMESHYICPFGYRLALCIKKFVKNTLTLTTRKSFLGVRLSLSHTHIDKHPRHFLLESPPPPPSPHPRE